VLEFGILFPSVLNGLTTGAVYALIALGLTLISASCTSSTSPTVRH